jgi:hypothetical protein
MRVDSRDVERTMAMRRLVRTTAAKRRYTASSVGPRTRFWSAAGAVAASDRDGEDAK